jgi:hypothetical protein
MTCFFDAAVSKNMDFFLHQPCDDQDTVWRHDFSSIPKNSRNRRRNRIRPGPGSRWG